MNAVSLEITINYIQPAQKVEMLTFCNSDHKPLVTTGSISPCDLSVSSSSRKRFPQVSSIGKLKSNSLEESINSLEAGLFTHPSHDDLTYLLHKCRKSRNHIHAVRLQKYLSKNGLDVHPLLGNQLASLLADVGDMTLAQDAFNMLPHRNESTWNALLLGYIRCGEPQKSLTLYLQIKEHESLHPHTIAALLKACSELGDIEKGKDIHLFIRRKGLLGTSVVVGNALIGFYGKCGYLAKAQEVFNTLQDRNIVSWNALIAGYVNHGEGYKALFYFDQMQHYAIPPNAVTFLCAIKACGLVGDSDKCQDIHHEISQTGLLTTDFRLGSTLLDIYAKFGLLSKAQDVFDMLSVRDVVSWTALISGYAEHGFGEEALNCLEQMKIDSVSPNAATFVCSLQACGSIGAVKKGEEIHAEIDSKRLLDKNIRLGNALVDMYAKCGLLVRAQEVFDKLPNRNVITWTALVSGYAQLGDIERMTVTLDRMIRSGIKPNVVTFLTVLNACTHTGSVIEGQTYFENMLKEYGIFPNLEHHTCMIDLLGRAGQLEKAVATIETMSFTPDLKVWHTVLRACRMLGNVDVGKYAFNHAVQLDEKDDSAYICMYNIYAHAGMREDAEKIQEMRVEREVCGRSHVLHPFLIDD